MALSVIGAGFGRTGTMSLKKALQKLGFSKCHHMAELIRNPEGFAYWGRLARGEPVDWEDVFRGYRASCDWPSAAYWRELAAHYTDAKVVLTVRSPESWFESMTQTIFANAMNPDTEKLESLPGEQHSDMQQTMTNFMRQFFPKGPEVDRELAISLFNAHNEEVKKTIPKERLLVFNVAEGWGPLCAFLGVPVPAEPFPRSNSAKEFGHAVESDD
jgi:hypothetical protein